MVVDLSVNTYLLNTERRTPWLVFAVRLLRRGGGRGRLEGGHRIPGRSCRPWGGRRNTGRSTGRSREGQGGAGRGESSDEGDIEDENRGLC